jgi:NADPH:quinone reductase-like Zn-dependent oxidoreductase
VNVCRARASDKLDQFTLARRRFDTLDHGSDAEGLYGENRGVAASSCMGLRERNATHDVKPVIDSVYSFDQVYDAIANMAGADKLGKVVIRVQ